MSIIIELQPEIEIVDNIETIRYLEHGWPTPLCRWHAHEEYELHLILETSGKVFIGDYVGEFKPGSLFLTGPNLPHNWVTEQNDKVDIPLRDMLIQFNHGSIIKAINAFHELSELNYLLTAARSGIEFKNYNSDLAKSSLASIRDSSGMSRIMNFLLFLQDLNEWKQKVSLSLTELTLNSSSEVQERINEIVNYVIDNYKSKITLDEVASIANMSKSSFSRYFMKTTGNRFSEFVARVRIGKACTLLHETDDNISTIAFSSGFNNLANFNRQFFNLKGMTPRDYKRTVFKGLANE